MFRRRLMCGQYALSDKPAGHMRGFVDQQHKQQEVPWGAGDSGYPGSDSRSEQVNQVICHT
jgi:hypothetical protein